MSGKEIARVVKHETLGGTYYIAQRLIEKGGIFTSRRMVWEDFAIYERTTANPGGFGYLSPYMRERDLFKNPATAERYCNEYVRCHADPDKVVKVWCYHDNEQTKPD